MTRQPFKFKHLENSYVLRQFIAKSGVTRAPQRLQRFPCLRLSPIFSFFTSLTARLAALRLDTFRTQRSEQ